MKRSYDQLHRTPSAAGLFDQHLPVNAVLEGGDVGDDAHKAVALGEGGEDADGLFQALVVQRAEALVEEEGIQPDAACGALYFVREAQRQRQ